MGRREMKSGEWETIKRIFALTILLTFIFSSTAFPAELRIARDLGVSLRAGALIPVFAETNTECAEGLSASTMGRISMGTGALNRPGILEHEQVTPRDTVETYDIIIEEEKKHNIYKEVAAFVVASAMVGYIVYLLINPGDNEQKSETNTGKDTPKPFLRTLIRVPIP